VRIFDLGCGCGVLAIAALLLWPRARAVAIDIDPEAIEVTLENAERSGTSDRMTTATAPIGELAGRFALVLANITGPTLIELAGAIVERVEDGGAVILSGVLSSEADQVLARFTALGLRCDRHEFEEEWSGILLRKPQGSR
jgi:ribosomal protein L11 methyltransferase